MASPPVCDFGWNAPHFSLPATDGKTYGLADIRGENGTLIAFICNHCPYVVAIAEKLVRDARELAALGVNTVAICSNDARSYPQDSFDKMIEFAAHYDFGFPYLHDETQEVAKAFDAVCTPDFFGFDAGLGLQYRGRLDAARPKSTGNVRRDLFEAMQQVALTGAGPADQVPSMGCSIKWKAA